jgi:hypothetical protein
MSLMLWVMQRKRGQKGTEADVTVESVMHAGVSGEAKDTEQGQGQQSRLDTAMPDGGLRLSPADKLV